jgi:hypothetical protein
MMHLILIYITNGASVRPYIRFDPRKELCAMPRKPEPEQFAGVPTTRENYKTVAREMSAYRRQPPALP